MLMDVWRLRFRGKEFISLDWTGWESTGSVKVSRDINKCTPGKQPKAVITETSLQLELGTFLCCGESLCHTHWLSENCFLVAELLSSVDIDAQQGGW
ncbi:hypothetical protein Leryth_024275 [Lithospermum erythrorhizon]|nr:hypothetical protein Leryth_024275 [Lithospermum erythrorhizon]